VVFTVIVPLYFALQFMPDRYSGIAPETLPPLIPQPPAFAILAFGLTVISAGFAVLIGSMIRQGRHWRRMHITADDWGIQWNLRRGPTISLAWHDVRSFFTISTVTSVIRSSNKLKSQVYVLDGSDTLLLWYAYPLQVGKASQVLPPAATRQREEIERFARLIITRTGKPLRDLSSYASELAIDSNVIAHAGMLPYAAEYQRLATPIAGLPVERRARTSRARGCALLALLLLPFVLVGGAFGAKAKLHDYQASYYASLPAKLHARQPLYFDALTAFDGDWYQSGPATAEGEYSYFFANGGYHLTAPKGQTAAALAVMPGTLSDVAVEMTVAQKVGMQYDGVGLVLRSDVKYSNMVVFFASPTDGSWAMDAYHFKHANPDDKLDVSYRRHVGRDTHRRPPAQPAAGHHARRACTCCTSTTRLLARTMTPLMRRHAVAMPASMSMTAPPRASSRTSRCIR